MRSKTVSLVSVYTILLAVLISSCKDDDKDPEPVVKPKLSFAELTRTVKESDGVIEIELKLDKAHDEDIVIEYALGGSARDAVTAGDNLVADYEILSDYLEVEIPQGETSAVIEIQLASDLLIEDDETIEITLESVNSEEIEITRDDEVVITVGQEDGLFVLLEWGVGEGEDYTDVDMDLFLWAENESGEVMVTDFRGLAEITNGGQPQVVATNWLESAASPEFFFLPTAILEDGTYGLSCIYYEGTPEPMNFRVTFQEVVNNEVAATEVKNGSYELDNINRWDDETLGTDPIQILTFKKVGADFTEFSDITIPDAGSRIGYGTFPPGIKRSAVK